MLLTREEVDAALNAIEAKYQSIYYTGTLEEKRDVARSYNTMTLMYETPRQNVLSMTSAWGRHIGGPVNDYRTACLHRANMAFRDVGSTMRNNQETLVLCSMQDDSGPSSTDVANIYGRPGQHWSQEQISAAAETSAYWPYGSSHEDLIVPGQVWYIGDSA
jgi:hypothetical protein